MLRLIAMRQVSLEQLRLQPLGMEQMAKAQQHGGIGHRLAPQVDTENVAKGVAEGLLTISP
jgi:hypothetical protein